MKVVYVAGPYRAPTEYEVYLNICTARHTALKVWRAGFVALCPHANTAFFGGAMPDDVWLAGDIELLKRCDALLLCEGWKNSQGVRAEKQVAELIGKPVFESVEALIAGMKP